MVSLLAEHSSDVRRTYGRPVGFLLRALAPFIHAGVRATLCYRLAHRCYSWRSTRVLAALLKRFARATTGAEIHPAASLGPGIHLPHPTGIIIGSAVTLAGECTVFHDVTIGPRTGSGAPDEGPTIGQHSFLYPGARVLGRITIGSRTQVGPNCVIFRDLPDGSTVLPAEPTVLEGLSFSLRFDEGAPEDEDDTGSENSAEDSEDSTAEEAKTHA